MKVLCIGSTTKDIFFPTDEGIVSDTPDDLMAQQKITFELGAKYHIEERHESIGGCAANVACGLSRLGLAAGLYTVLGDDIDGKWIKDVFKKEKIGDDLVFEAQDCKSDLSAIVVDKKSGDRVIFTNQTVNAKLKIDPDKLKDASWIFIGDLNGNWQENLDVIIKSASEKNIPVAFNPRQKTIHDDPYKIIEAAKGCKNLFLNKDESIEIVSSLKKGMAKDDLNDEIFLIKELKNIGVDIVVITDGKKGAWAFDGKKIIHTSATCDSPLETTGAGDAFTSGFLAAHIKGKNLEESLKWGTANSGNSVKFYGAISGLLSENEILNIADGIQVKYLDI